MGYTRADHSGDDAQDPASPEGAPGLSSGEYLRFGIGTFKFFNGMSDAGQVGTFVFDLLAPPAGVPATACGQVLCLAPDLPFNPFVSLAGENLTADLFPADYVGALVEVNTAAVPAPATLALFGLGLAGLGWSRRKKA